LANFLVLAPFCGALLFSLVVGQQIPLLPLPKALPIGSVRVAAALWAAIQ
jgi:hypothetical protein